MEAKDDVTENLEAIRTNLSRCMESRMVDDPNATYYNEVVDLIDEASVAKDWDELEEIIEKAKTLEVDVAVWLARYGQTSIALPWPHRPI